MMKTFKEYENIDKLCESYSFEHEAESLQESEYQGKKVTLNDPTRSSDGKKKFYVYVKNEKGNTTRFCINGKNKKR